MIPNTTDATVDRQLRRASLTSTAWFLALLGITGLVALLLIFEKPKPSLAIVAWLLFLTFAAAVLYQPRYGVYLTLFLALVGDSLLAPWYPFFKNFSSRESLFYLHKSLIFSPLELFLVLTLVSWLGRALTQRKLKFYTGPLFWPVIIFTIFIMVGFFFGVARGGNMNIALWEVRPILYLPLFFILVSNLVTKREHVNNLLWAVMIALFIEGLVGSWYYFFVLKGNLGLVDRITEHSAAIHMNTVFVFAIAAWIYKASPAKRIILLLMIPPILLTYLATQRRAAYVALILALIFLAVMLYRESRLAFWLVVPPLALIGALYLGAYWNSSGALGKPAQAVKSVIAPSSADERDRRSNDYRDIENYNALFTIRSTPVTGVGFGNQFYIVVPLPDISFFEWWQYMTHNSVVYIWMKAGIAGFVAMLMMIGMAIMLGVRVVLRMPRGNLKAIALVAVLYIVMHFVYAYVDISWDNQSMLYVGAMLGLINSLEHIVAKPVPAPAKRWPWQTEPTPLPGLQPLPGE